MSRGASQQSFSWQVLPFRARPDVALYPLVRGGRRVWGIKDPWTLRYFEFGEEERFILEQLDGRCTAEAIRRMFDTRFAPRHLSEAELRSFLVRSHQQGLIVSDLSGQGRVLRQRQTEERRQAWLSKLANPLAIRFRGLDPQRFLDGLYPLVRPFFATASVIACCLTMIAALAIVGWNFETIVRRMPEFETFWNPSNVFWLAAALALTKVLHEFGHALACKHFGGECHELGLLLLVFTPCLYCNVSDAWRVPNKWHRVAIDAAGMFVECTLAAVCTLLWWWSEPGILEAFWLNMMFVCSVSTLVFNGNPLLRYDGYYILSDVLEIPNLGDEATAALKALAARWFLGHEASLARLGPPPSAWLPVYAAFSLVYRWSVVVGFIWLAHRALQPWGLDFLVWMLGLSVIGVPVASAVGMVLDRRPRVPLDRFRLVTRAGAVVLLFAVVLSVPLPDRPRVPLVIEPRAARSIYTSVDGRLIEAVKPGQVVVAGQRVAKLENLELERQLAKLQGEHDAQVLHLHNLERRRIADSLAGDLLPAAREALGDLKQRLLQKKEEFARLTLLAPAGGTVFPPSNRREADAPGSLRSWQGTPLDPRNAACFVETGTLICRVGNPAELEAWAVIDQTDVDGMRAGQNARIVLDEQPGVIHQGTIVEVAEVDLELTPRELVARELVASRPDPRGLARPRSTSYYARIQLDTLGEPLAIGTAGEARIDVGWRSLASRLVRLLSRSFRIDW